HDLLQLLPLLVGQSAHTDLLSHRASSGRDRSSPPHPTATTTNPANQSGQSTSNASQAQPAPPEGSPSGQPPRQNRLARRGKPLARRFVLGVAYGAGTGVGGFAIGYVIWWLQSR
ncbi:hypothetical protein ABZ490_45180, partial [Streptomyces sp. NPDC005811]